MGRGAMAREETGSAATAFEEPPHVAALRAGVRAVCARYPDAYWRELDARREYPEAFVRAMTEAGWLGALIPEEYGGLGLGLMEAAVILEEVNRQGGNAGPAHAQMYVMGTPLDPARPAGCAPAGAPGPRARGRRRTPRPGRAAP